MLWVGGWSSVLQEVMNMMILSMRIDLLAHLHLDPSSNQDQCLFVPPRLSVRPSAEDEGQRLLV